MICFSVLSALFRILHKTMQSSAYLTNLCPLRSSSLSSSFSITFPHNGLNGPPWGTPSDVAWNPPSSITPAFRYLCISEITRPSLMVLDSTSISLLWFTVSKYACKSMLIAYIYPSFTYSLHFSSASCALLPGRMNILRWQSHPISRNRATGSVIESRSSDGGSHDLCRGSQYGDLAFDRSFPLPHGYFPVNPHGIGRWYDAVKDRIGKGTASQSFMPAFRHEL